MTQAALLTTALLFGGMVFYSFGFAAFLFKNLPAEKAGHLLRRAFPVFYLCVIACAGLAAALSVPFDLLAAAILAVVALTTIPARQVLMPAINAASDAGHSRRFGVLHGSSVVLGIAQIIAVGWALTRFL
ncbi:MAG: DUF4149 domain-containing protein [Paracoccaceae bacterium]|nr:DUF4149 domain-containing protein [Paracoccaceae bacterium]